MSILIQNWWVLVLRGVVAVIFGVLAYLWPGATIASFVLLYGAYALVDGIFSLVAAFRPAPGESRWWLILSGVVSVLAGLIVLMRPGLSALFLLFVVAAWAIASGITRIVAAIALRKVVTGEWLLVLSGALSILLGLFMFSRPAAGLLGLVWAIAFYAIVAGILLILLGFRLRSWSKTGGARIAGGRPAGA